MDNFLKLIKDLAWPELIIEDEISIKDTDKVIFRKNSGKGELLLVQRYLETVPAVNEGDEELERVAFRYIYSNLEMIKFPLSFPIEEVLTKDLKLRHYASIDDVFHFNSRQIKILEITAETDRFELQENKRTLLFNPTEFLRILSTYNGFYTEGKSYSKKLINYKSNEFQKSYFGIEKEKKTLSSKGEFSFLIDRFNIPTKKNKTDFERYLNDNDLLALQELNLKLIQKEVFGADYLTKLNDYFIKVRLEEIISLGREILNLKSSSLVSAAAKKTIAKVESDGRKIKQMESVWQKYFENYLSFLIFSYQKLYPKIELNVDLSKKYPDFIGINHFGGVDILEIKTHLKHVVTKDPSHDNYAFSSELSKAVIQTINYMDALIQEKIKSKTIKEDLKGEILEGNIYRPRGIIIISSYEYLAKGIKVTDPEFKKVQRDFTKLRNGLHNIQILTFDELLNMAENYKDNIVK
ncbi:DUF4263 domain-containing protein [Flavobacterium sp. YJ01]|uniref:Shedu immune nuclease family protein n=1 Tax=Flavobacterium sp. YJ01 TaxID=3031997 RepID=UPI0023E37983|nr:Shedu immune nuclease family protein [Flavobacterium sp. YJ01]WET03364.1 DUF4263 domain-containing protein [Flavobacterium sp. YJ01]